MLQVYHEQRSALGHNVVDVPNIPERVVELGAGQAIHAVDRNLQRSGQSLCLCRIVEILRQPPAEERLGFVVFLMLNQDTGILQIPEILRMIPEQVFLVDGGRMHAGNIQQSHVPMDPLLCVHISAFPDDFPAISADTTIKGILWKDRLSVLRELRILWIQVHRLNIIEAVKRIIVALVPEEAIVQLRMFFPAEDDPCGERVRCVVHAHVRQLRQDLPCRPVRLPRVEYRFRRKYVVIAVFRYLQPPFLWHRLVPRQSQFLMVDPQLNFPFLQRLLF